jgi:protein-S-isoprenylcysteine O-methyltransferase Ste14
VNLHYPDSLLHWLLAGSAASTVAFFGVGLTLNFERSPRAPWVIVVHYASMVLALLQVAGVVVFPTRSDVWVGTAIGMYLLALAVFLSAIESAQRTRLQRSFVDHPLPDRLITDGPFRWVRHPFCTGYLLAALAGPVAIDHVVMIAIAVPLMLTSIYAAFREERVWLASSRADEYRDYQRRTGMFIPFVGRK